MRLRSVLAVVVTFAVVVAALHLLGAAPPPTELGNHLPTAVAAILLLGAWTLGASSVARSPRRRRGAAIALLTLAIGAVLLHVALLARLTYGLPHERPRAYHVGGTRLTADAREYWARPENQPKSLANIVEEYPNHPELVFPPDSTRAAGLILEASFALLMMTLSSALLCLGLNVPQGLALLQPHAEPLTPDVAVESTTPAMPLASRSLAELQAALLDAFPEPSDLAQMTSLHFDLNLNTISEGNLGKRVFDLVQWAAARGKLDELVMAARAANPDNPLLLAFAASRGLGPAVSRRAT